MNSSIKYVLLLVTLIVFASCEERTELDTPFPNQDQKLFCEIIGFPDLGFIGTVTAILPVQSTSVEDQNILVKIWENDELIIEETVFDIGVFFDYPVQATNKYRLEVTHNNQVITNQGTTSSLPQLVIENESAQNDYVDSLGLYVSTINYQYEPAGQLEPYYQIFTSNLTSGNFPVYSITDYSDPVEIDGTGGTKYISKRIPNPFFNQYVSITNYSIDRDLYQYLKNINQLNQIPNDNIEGHHGNLENGVGYFGVVNYFNVVVEM